MANLSQGVMKEKYISVVVLGTTNLQLSHHLQLPSGL